MSLICMKLAIALCMTMMPPVGAWQWEVPIQKGWEVVSMKTFIKAKDPCVVAVEALQGKEEHSMVSTILNTIFTDPCRYFGQFSEQQVEQCYVAESSPTVQYLVSIGIESPEFICQYRTLPKIKTPDACDLCEKTTKMLERAIDQQIEDVEIVRDALKMLCDNIPHNQRCLDLLHQFDHAIDLLKQGLSPHHVCVEIHFCDSKKHNSKHSQQLIKHEKNYQYDKTLVIMDTLLDVQQKLLNVSKANTNGDVLECTACAYVARNMQSVIQYDKDLLPKFKQGIEYYCKALSGFEFCKDLLDNFDAIADNITKGSTPEEACGKTSMCKPDSTTDVSNTKHTTDNIVQNQIQLLEKKLVASMKGQNVDDSLECLTCMYVSKSINAILSTSPENLEMLQKTLPTVCEALPKSSRCMAVLDKFNALVQDAKDGIEPERSCEMSHFCQSHKRQHLRLQNFERDVVAMIQNERLNSKSGKNNNSGCILCSFIAESIIVANKEDKSILPLIKEGLQTMCTFLPVDAKCDQISENFEKLVKLLETDESVSLACQRINVCDDAKKSISFKQVETNNHSAKISTIVKVLKLELIMSKKDFIGCYTCKIVGNAIEQVIEVAKEELPLLKEELEVICGNLPDITECKQVLSNFDSLAKQIEDGTSAEDACKKIGQCDKDLNKPTTLSWTNEKVATS